MTPVRWWAGLTCDHLYAECPNRLRAEKSLRGYGYWNLNGDSLGRTLIDPLGTDVCGMCRYRYVRASRSDASLKVGSS